LGNDVLGRFNLTVRGHAFCVKKMMAYGVPLLLLGGGGYSVHNVARCWLYETGLAIGEDIDGNVPKHDRFY
jgi:histone deacetylase 1/2